MINRTGQILVMSSIGTACHYYSVVTEQSRLGQILQSPGSSCIQWTSWWVCSWTHCVDKFINNSLTVAACYSWRAAWVRESINYCVMEGFARLAWLTWFSLDLTLFSSFFAPPLSLNLFFLTCSLLFLLSCILLYHDTEIFWVRWQWLCLLA